MTLLTDARGEPLYVHVLPFGDGRDPDIAVSVRELGIEREAFARKYGLSPREAEVAELVLRGYPQSHHRLDARHRADNDERHHPDFDKNSVRFSELERDSARS